MAKIPVLVAGAGSWGTALALVLARNQHVVCLWDNNSAHMTKLQKDRRNDLHIPGISFPQEIRPVINMEECSSEIRDVVMAVPCSGLREVLSQLSAWQGHDFNICIACKGFATGDRVLNHEVVDDVMHGQAHIAVLSGPSFAGEVARGLPTAVTIACADKATANHFAGCFHNDVFRTYTNNDIIGVQICGAVKNVMAIGAGIADGLGFGANSRAALITRGLAEITRLGLALGGHQETFMGLAGLGDLVLTCTDDQSRNRRLGLALAHGEKLEDAVRRIGQAIEGIHTAAEVIRIAAEYSIEMPIAEQVQQVLSGKVTPKAAVHNLLSRTPRSEQD
jgi:glycerol-3-phosphate dehydrogenase (NAD(P)+)